jgi:SAM-dependent methyltransferase
LKPRGYMMEDEEEALRLDLKTDPAAVRRQARWAGIRPGMRVGDFGCGPGVTSYHLNRVVQPGGSVVGLDFAPGRIAYARERYAAPGIEYAVADIRGPLERFGPFDVVWVRFVLEYYRSTAFEIVRNVLSVLKPGGIICLADLDHNCLSHFAPPPRAERALYGVMAKLEAAADFDPYAGRKLYAHLYDLGLAEIRATLFPHHLIYGPRVRRGDLFNWTKKVAIAARNSGYPFDEYPDGFEGFRAEFEAFFHDPRRFTYTPILLCRGRKPEGRC